MPNHTPTPWKAEGRDGHMITAGGQFVASLLDRGDVTAARLDAHHIVRAVNAHDALVDALEAMLAAYQVASPRDPALRVRDAAFSAIKLAKGA